MRGVRAMVPISFSRFRTDLERWCVSRFIFIIALRARSVVWLLRSVCTANAEVGTCTVLSVFCFNARMYLRCCVYAMTASWQNCGFHFPCVPVPWFHCAAFSMFCWVWIGL